MSEIEQAISALEHLFLPDRYPSYKDEWNILVKAARIFDSLDKAVSIVLDDKDLDLEC